MIREHSITLKHAYQAPKKYVWLSSDEKSQEFRNAGAYSKDVNIEKIYLLEKAYEDGSLAKPIGPDGNPYNDPSVDPHIIAATNIDAELKRLFLDEPWNCDHNKSDYVNKIRFTGKTLNYAAIFLSSAASLAEQMKCTPEEAEKRIKNYFSYPDGFYGLDKWLQFNAKIGVEQKWIRTALGGMIYVNDSNSKGIGGTGTVRRKSCNGRIQGLASEQLKITLVKVDKYYDALNFKYRKCLEGREGRIVAPVHDELNTIAPGEVRMVAVPDKKNPNLIHYKSLPLDRNIPEEALAAEYADALLTAMLEGMQMTFDLLKSNIPAGASIKVAKHWDH